MLFKHANGELKEIKRYDCKNDRLYYKKIMDIYKERELNKLDSNTSTETCKNTPMSQFATLITKEHDLGVNC